ncbi:MAG: hypothetical protein ACYTFG_19810 [Planctomycetota bacterium]
MWEVTLRRIRGSRGLQILAVVTAVDTLGYIWLSSSERLGWASSFILFLFSAGCWFWAVTWPPFWNHLTLPWQGPGTRRYLSFIERFGIVTLFFVQAVYTAIFVFYVSSLFMKTG